MRTWGRRPGSDAAGPGMPGRGPAEAAAAQPPAMRTGFGRNHHSSTRTTNITGTP
jgi:hypothetical protein